MNRRSFMLSSVALGALAAAAPTVAFAQDITILGSVPSLSFPFFVHMLNQIKAEATAQGVGIIESDGQNSAPKQTADIEAAMSGNICRCGTYTRIKAAIKQASGQKGA